MQVSLQYGDDHDTQWPIATDVARSSDVVLEASASMTTSLIPSWPHPFFVVCTPADFDGSKGCSLYSDVVLKADTSPRGRKF